MTRQAVPAPTACGGPQVDVDKLRFDRLVHEFGRALPDVDVALFYYAGHGMQVQGVNWLIPIDADPSTVKDLDFQMVDAGLVLRQMEGTKLNIVILDACRNNPFLASGIRDAAGGLGEMSVPEGTLISYATKPGKIAVDGAGPDSPYTTALVNAIRNPGSDVFHIFNDVGLAVKQATGGTQLPWLSLSPIAGDFFFFTKSGTMTLPRPATLIPPSHPVNDCPNEKEFRSIEGNKSTSITFVNQRTSIIQTYWLNYQGARQLYWKLNPGEQYNQQTYVTHPWVVTDDNDNCLGIFLPEQNQITLTIR